MNLLHAFRRLKYALALAFLAGVISLLADLLIGVFELPSSTRNLAHLVTGSVFILATALALFSAWKTAQSITDQAGSTEKMLRQAQEAEKALQLSEARFRLITANVPAAISLIGPDLRYRYANGRYEEWLGVDAAQIAGLHVREVIGEEGFKRGLPYMLAALEGQQQTFENVIRGPKGIDAPVLVNFVPAVSGSEVEGFYVLMTDVTALKRAEVNLIAQARTAREQLAELESIYDTAHVGLGVLDTENRFVRVNRRLAEMNGVPVAEHIGRTMREVVPGIASQAEAVIRQIVETGEPVLDVELNGETPAQPGVQRSWIEQWLPLRDADGAIFAVNIVVEEVTEVRRYQQEQLRLLGEVQEQRRCAETLAEALQEERDVLETIMENTHTQFAYLDPAFNFVRVNSAFASQIAMPREALIGRNHFSVFPDEESRTIFEQVWATGAPAEYRGRPMQTPREDERTTYWDWTLVPVKSERGQTQGLVFSLTNVTEQKLAEEVLRNARDELEQAVQARTQALTDALNALDSENAERRRAEAQQRLILDQLQASELRFRAFFANAPVAVALQHPTGQIIEANPALEQLVGMSNEELQRRTWSDLVHPDDVAGDFELFQEMLEGRRANYHAEKRLLSLSGEERWVRLTVSAARNLKAAPHLIVTMAEDVTAAKAAARELMEREQQYRSIFESTSDGLVILDRRGQVVDANPAATAISGYTREELTRLDPTTMITTEHREAFDEFLQHSYQAGQIEAATVGVRKNGEPFDLEVRVSRFTYRGEPHLLSIVRDITERVRSIQLLEARVKERTRELSMLLDVSRSMSATLEQRTLLAVVADQVNQLLPGDSVLLYVLHEDRLILAEHRGFDRDQVLDEAIGLTDPAMRDEARRQEAPYVIADVRGESPDGFAGSIRNRIHALLPAARSLIWAPLCVKGRVAGGLGVASETLNRFAPRDAELLATVANQAAVALDNARLYEQAQELAILQERQRLARELHDSVTQALYSLVLMTEATRRLMALNQTERMTVFLARIAETAQQVLKEMRLLVYELRPTVLARDGLISALRQRLQTVEGRAGVEGQLLITGNAYVPESIEGELYRVAQEALNNALKHSGATTVIVQLNLEPDTVCLSVKDNGRGFDAGHQGDGGMGLSSMKERAQRMGGKIDVSSTVGQGTTVTLAIPLPANQGE